MTDFILGFHCHQPLGNFDEVMLEAATKAYLPLLRALEAHPGVKVVLHFSGCLLEWADAKAPEVIDRTGTLVARGQAELLGGGFHEPLLPIIPETDAIAQIEALRRWILGRFGVKPRGIWLAERVWEPSIAATLSRAGVEYLPVDDTHLLGAGLNATDLAGPWRTGEEGASVVLYPIREALRYLIPFEPVAASVDWLRRLGETRADALAVMADDGEKFGVWPGTRKRCYDERWLERLEEALAANPWIAVRTPAEAVATHAPLGLAYLPSASYHEMQEWALPPAGQARYHAAAKALEPSAGAAAHDLLRGGHWRNFQIRYPEANRLHKRMLRASLALRARGESGGGEWGEARTHLWRAQCNCPYWHGVFGGLYLPHLRGAVYGELIAAETFLAGAAARV